MTCIVAAKDRDGTIWVGADSAGVGGMDSRVRTDEKVFVKDKVIFGFTSSFRMGQLLRYHLKIPPHDTGLTASEYVYTVFVDAVRKCLKEGGFATVNNNSEAYGEFIFGYEGQIYIFESDAQIGTVADGYAACGCGANYALGYMFAVEARLSKDHCIECIKGSLVAAQHFSAGVREPFIVKGLRQKA